MASISSLGIGSGMDLNGLLDQLRSAERQQLEPLVAQQKSYQAQVSAFGKLESALSSFQDAAAKLNDTSLYESLSTSVTGESVTASASSEAQSGTYDVNVTNLARAQSIATDGFAARDAEQGSGTMTIDVGTGGQAQALTIDIAQADSTLEGIRDAINAEDAGVTASIVNDGGASPYRLVLSSDETGTEAAIQSVAYASDAGDTALDDKLSFGGSGTMAETVAAEDAALTVNGIGITSQSNTVEGAIQGVTLEIAEAGESTVKVEQDNLAVRDAISGFVKAHNDLQGTIDKLTSFDGETGAAGTLLGDGTLRSVESRLREVLTDTVDAGTFDRLTEVGISRQLDGTLELDDETLDDVIANDRQSLIDFFAGTDSADGLSDTLDGTLGRILDDGGTLDNATTGLESRIEGLDERKARMERSIDRTIERYRSQFGQLDSMIANMNQTSTYLAQQFSSLNAQLGQN
ncbi:flagellar filament capping protein FliD [Halomonas beimenensis]|uniref:Flagellar hook-associated protein 2 n=1 Tax=Halomonas beimenensis TaxID=475662 RepID=A0A291PCN8_9GAMM|nr:flagellar filament capping protein FliD [Halomonas beimenensis]ATJ84642.1 flagellar cap protein FliD [Halomonas beimenensis]